MNPFVDTESPNHCLWTNQLQPVFFFINPSVNILKCPVWNSSGPSFLPVRLPVSLSSLWAVVLCVCHGRRSVQLSQRRKRRGHLDWVTLSQRPHGTQPELRFQTIITFQVGRNSDSGCGNISPRHLQWPLPEAHSFFTPLEIALLTWVDKSSYCVPRLFTFLSLRHCLRFIQEELSVSAEREHLGRGPFVARLKEQLPAWQLAAYR